MNKYKVIIWGFGSVGQYALKMMLDKKSLEVVGVIDIDPAKVGRDAGEVIGRGNMGVLVSSDVEATLAIPADVVLLYVNTPYDKADMTPRRWSPAADLICKAMDAGKNVLTTMPIYFSKDTVPEVFEKVNGCALKNGVTYTQQGIFPGLFNPYLPVVIASMCGKIDKIILHGGQDDAYNTSAWVRIFGYGAKAEDYDPTFVRSMIWPYYGPAVRQIAERAGIAYDEYREEHRLFTADVEMNPPCGNVQPGTISAHAFDMYCTKDGEEVAGFHFIHKVCHDIQPEPLCYDGYRIVGEPNLDIVIKGMIPEDVPYASSAAPSVNLIPQVVEAAPGFVDALDLPAAKPVL